LAASVASVTQRLAHAVAPPAQRQRPSWQVPPGPQAFPQAPQFEGSRAVTVQAPWQASKPPGHSATQPASGEQRWPGPQTTPQAPQFRGSFRGTQVPPHARCATVHWQVAPTQLAPLQETPQPPQAPGSVWGLTHCPAQPRNPAGHPSVHRPSLQLWPAGQAPSQLPQCWASLAVSTQRPLHSVLPAGQTQALRTHACPVAQACPQAPQLAGSLAVSAQVQPSAVQVQLVLPGAQPQAPARQLAPEGQALPQAPQFAASLRGSTQRPLHSDCPGGQPQVPDAQTSVGRQARAQLPQWALFVRGSTQAPSHERKPCGQAQVAPRHS
jgi:hypothetical protein